MDGSLKAPYRHPHYGQQRNPGHGQQLKIEQAAKEHQKLHTQQQQDTFVEENPDADNPKGMFRQNTPMEFRRTQPLVKAAKLNIPEFLGEDADSWIQIIEEYFDSARTPLDQRTHIAVTYLTGPAIQWWRSTGLATSTIPWHRFCRYLTDRFSLTSVCDNVRTFHTLTQISTVADYITRFEKAMNLMRRDNPMLPDDYYVNSFISGLQPYIQTHLQCLKPSDLQQAMWYARRLEQATPQQQAPKPYFPSVRRQIAFDNQKSVAVPSLVTPAAIIQQATHKNICYKCKEPWFPGHKKVCKMSHTAQVHALQSQNTENPDIIYIHEYDGESDNGEESADNPALQISMHALTGKKARKYTFTLYITIGKVQALALVDTGSTTTFITPALAQKANCNLTPTTTEKVLVANGETLWTSFLCKDITYDIQGVPFQSDFRILNLKGYDIILGADWIYEHSPVELNLKALTLKVQHKDEMVTFFDASLPASADIPQAVNASKLLSNSICGAFLLISPFTDKTEEVTPIPPAIQAVLTEFQDIFDEPTTLPPRRTCDHVIHLDKDAKILNQRCYRVPHHQKNVLEKLVADLLKNQFIRPSSSPYSSPALVVKKKDFDWRLCIDFRKLNANTIKNKFPIPVIEDLLDELHGANIFSKIDLRSGYHQIRMAEKDIDKTAFSTHQGHYEYVVMPFGLTNAPATFQQLMNNVLEKFLRKFALVFFDDILIYSKSVQEHTVHLQQVFTSLRSNKLFAKRKKCTFAQEKVEYLGHIITGQGVATDPTKIEAITNWPIPTNVTELRSFLGLAGYYRRFVQNYGIICRPLFAALKKEGFTWSEEQTLAFTELKQKMTTTPVLAMPDFSQPFVLETDASGYGIGAVLMQQGKPISFMSKAIGPKAAALSTYDKEALAIIEALKNGSTTFLPAP
jgi:hypothetical protein